MSEKMNQVVELSHKFSFDSAHSLPNVPEDHKCRRLHGHTFHVEVLVQGTVGETSGWVMDYGQLKEVVRPVIALLDHRHLNEIDGLENPTSEHIAMWIWKRITDGLPGLSCVSIHETCNTGCHYRGQ